MSIKSDNGLQKAGVTNKSLQFTESLAHRMNDCNGVSCYHLFVFSQNIKNTVKWLSSPPHGWRVWSTEKLSNEAHVAQLDSCFLTGHTNVGFSVRFPYHYYITAFFIPSLHHTPATWPSSLLMTNQSLFWFLFLPHVCHMNNMHKPDFPRWTCIHLSGLGLKHYFLYELFPGPSSQGHSSLPLGTCYLFSPLCLVNGH